MNDEFVPIEVQRHRGWPWPDDSWGLGPMYGEDGWCHSCGTPLVEQVGPLTLRRSGFKTVKGAWVPNWCFDSICVEASLGQAITERFRVQVRPVAWRGKSADALQLVPSVSPEPWFDPDELRSRVIARHGEAGSTCGACGIWRWFPLPSPEMPERRVSIASIGDLVASPEWFGAGCDSFRELHMRRELAETLASASPRDFRVLK